MLHDSWQKGQERSYHVSSVELVSSPQEILEYLDQKPDSDKHQDFFASIEKSRVECSKFSSEQLQNGLANLAKRRLLASNTLIHESETLKLWDAANQFIGMNIESPHPSLAQICQLNATLQGMERSTLRNSETYSCDEQYLPASHIQEAIRIFDKKSQSDCSPFEKAFFFYLWTITVHPFNNANGRTARLSADWVLIANEHLPISFHSPIESHVAVTIGGKMRTIDDSYRKFLKAVLNSYQTVLK